MNDKTNVDVLTVLDAYCAQYARGKGTDLKEARAAVAELVAQRDALKDALEDMLALAEMLSGNHPLLDPSKPDHWPDAMPAARAALARVGGAA